MSINQESKLGRSHGRQGPTRQLEHKIRRLVVFFALSSAFVSGVQGQTYNTYISGESQMGTAPTPVDNADVNRAYDWSNPPWAHRGPAAVQPDGNTITGSFEGDLVIRGGGHFRSFGMDNWFQNEDWVKTFTVEFDFDGGVPLAGMADNAAQAGTHPTSGYNGDITDTFISQEVTDGPDGLQHYVLNWEFDPQPDWEFVTIQNVGAGPMTLSNISFKSVCVPSPGAASLGVLGGLLTCRRRRA
jgi:hypothetical protein